MVVTATPEPPPMATLVVVVEVVPGAWVVVGAAVVEGASQLVGSVTLARAVPDEAFADRIAMAAVDALLPPTSRKK